MPFCFGVFLQIEFDCLPASFAYGDLAALFWIFEIKILMFLLVLFTQPGWKEGEPIAVAGALLNQLSEGSHEIVLGRNQVCFGIRFDAVGPPDN
ncbi:hypothetical protein D3C73_1217210 [compost metagenome]